VNRSYGYPHTPILRPPAARRFIRFWASGEHSSLKWEIPCPGRPWTNMQNLTPLALSSPEKSVTVQKSKQDVRLRGRPYIHTHAECVPGRAPRPRHPCMGLASIVNTCRCAPIRPILGFWGSKIPPKWEFPCLGRRWTAVQNLTPL